MSSELPNELWTVVLCQVNDVRDWGRVQQINKIFHSLVAANCWPRVHMVEVAQATITINGQTLELSLVHQVLLLLQLAAKATKLTVLHMKDMDPVSICAPETLRHDKQLHMQLLGELLSLLSRLSLKVEELGLEGLTISPTPIVQALASFLASISTTLKTLQLVKVSVFAIPPVLLQSFQACSLLEMVNFDVQPIFRGLSSLITVFACSVLSGKDMLKCLHITSSQFLNTQELAVIVAVSGATLTSLTTSCDWASKWGSFLWHYTCAVHVLFLSTSHPLRTLKKLYVDVYLDFGSPPRVPIPWHLLPELELVSFASLHRDDLPVLYGGFIHAFHSPGGAEKVVHCVIPVLCRNGNVEALVTQIQALIPCEAMVTELLGGGVDIQLIRGNTIFTIHLHDC